VRVTWRADHSCGSADAGDVEQVPGAQGGFLSATLCPVGTHDAQGPLVTQALLETGRAMSAGQVFMHD
jgi:hypothetical protein